VQSVAGGCLIVGSKLYFYVSGRAGVAGSAAQGVCSTGLAILRRDGFASMDAGATGGTLTTRPLRFSKQSVLFVNVDAPEGELRVEVLDEKGAGVLQSEPIKGDTTLRKVTWPEQKNLEPLVGKTIRLRFTLRNGALYSFWTGDDAGASRGQVAAGGPRLTGPIDTVGEASLGK